MFIRLLGLWCARQELNLHPLGIEPNGNVTLVEELLCYSCVLRFVCILFRQVAQKISARRQPYLDLFVQPDEKSCCAIRTPELCGIAQTFFRNALANLE